MAAGAGVHQWNIQVKNIKAVIYVSELLSISFQSVAKEITSISISQKLYILFV